MGFAPRPTARFFLHRALVLSHQFPDNLPDKPKVPRYASCSPPDSPWGASSDTPSGASNDTLTVLSEPSCEPSGCTLLICSSFFACAHVDERGSRFGMDDRVRLVVIALTGFASGFCTTIEAIGLADLCYCSGSELSWESGCVVDSRQRWSLTGV